MSDQIIRLRLLVLLFLTAASMGTWVVLAAPLDDSSSLLQVHFLDVGQGDAIFVATPDGVHVLIDGGRDASVLRELGREMSVADRSIDMVVATHPDADHIGGLVAVLERYDIARILMTENQSDSQVATRFNEEINKEGVDVVFARRGQVWQLGASTTLEVLFPETDPKDLESNTSSIVLQLKYGEVEFMLTGDSPKSIEEYLVLRDGEHLESEVLKVGHHGSRTSTSELFLGEVNPRYAVISASADNSYGHPHSEVTDMLFNNRVETLSTAESGTITFYSDGEEVWLE